MTAYLIALDCFDDARSHASQALEAAQDVRSPVLTAFVLQHVAAIAALQRRPGETRPATQFQQAATLLGFVEARLKSLGARRDHTERQEYDRIIAALGDVLADQRDDFVALGAQWTEAAALTAANRWI